MTYLASPWQCLTPQYIDIERGATDLFLFAPDEVFKHVLSNALDTAPHARLVLDNRVILEVLEQHLQALRVTAVTRSTHTEVNTRVTSLLRLPTHESLYKGQ